MIDVYATWSHYLDHLLDATAGLDVRVVCPTEALAVHAYARGARNVTRGNVRMPGGPTLVAGYADARDTHASRPLALVEHGAGQTYLDVEHMGYAGGPGWSRLDLVLSPGPHAAARWRAAYPSLRVVEIGAPEHRPYAGPTGLVAVTFHWRCNKTIESGTAWREWQDTVARLPRERLLGTWHPRWGERRGTNNLADWWTALGVEVAEDVEDVFARADVLVCDNTSLAYEFAATGRPVVSLNASWWRKDVEHGLRFWAHVPGIMLDPGDDLAAGIDAALTGAGEDARRAAVAHAYGGARDDGRAALASWVRACRNV